jgi:hypothetical protein
MHRSQDIILVKVVIYPRRTPTTVITIESMVNSKTLRNPLLAPMNRYLVFDLMTQLSRVALVLFPHGIHYWVRIHKSWLAAIAAVTRSRPMG